MTPRRGDAESGWRPEPISARRPHLARITGRPRLLAALVAASCLAAPQLHSGDFWTERPYSEWTTDECQKLVTRSAQGSFPWKRTFGRSGFTVAGALIWYSDTVWRAYYRFKEHSEEDMKRLTAQCRPSLLFVLLYTDDPGHNTRPYKANTSPGDLVGSTYLENSRGERLSASFAGPSCLPYVDKYTIIFNFPITDDTAAFFSRSSTITFVCAGLGVAETFGLDRMRVGGARDCYWGSRAGRPQEPVVAERRVPKIEPLPFKVFPE
ncbi:MAG: hypothetical protein AB1714_12035 [Acidobacteriota bacterium]